MQYLRVAKARATRTISSVKSNFSQFIEQVSSEQEKQQQQQGEEGEEEQKEEELNRITEEEVEQERLKELQEQQQQQGEQEEKEQDFLVVNYNTPLVEENSKNITSPKSDRNMIENTSDENLIDNFLSNTPVKTNGPLTPTHKISNNGKLNGKSNNENHNRSNGNHGDKHEYDLSVTPQVVEFATALADHAQTFTNFPYTDNKDGFELTDKQIHHARELLIRCPAMAKLRYRLCPSSLKETEFWRVYFVLLNNIKKRSDSSASLPATPPPPVAYKSSSFTTPKKLMNINSETTSVSPKHNNNDNKKTANNSHPQPNGKSDNNNHNSNNSKNNSQTNGKSLPFFKQKVKSKLATIGSPKDNYDPHAEEESSPTHKTNGITPKANEKPVKLDVDFDEIDLLCGISNLNDLCGIDQFHIDDSDTDSELGDRLDLAAKTPQSEIEPSHPVPKSELTPPHRPLAPINTEIVNSLPPLFPPLVDPEPISPLTPSLIDDWDDNKLSRNRISSLELEEDRDSELP